MTKRPARSPNASETEVDISRLANIRPSSSSRTGLAVAVEPVRGPDGHEPRVHDRQGQDQRLDHAAGVDLLEQVVGELADREDVDEVEEQLQRRDRSRHFAGADQGRDAGARRRRRLHRSASAAAGQSASLARSIASA